MHTSPERDDRREPLCKHYARRYGVLRMYKGSEIVILLYEFGELTSEEVL